MAEAEEKKAVKEQPAEKPAASKAAKPTDVVEVKNISKRRINTRKGSIDPGETGKATVAELRQLHRYLEKA